MWSLLSTPGISENIKSDGVHWDPLPCVASGSRCHTADYLNETKDVDSNVPCLSSSLLKSPSVSTNIKSDGMVQAWASQKRLKRDILSLFMMSDI